jgi:hypothetical protein
MRFLPSTCTSSLLHELDQLSLHEWWFRSCIRFYNRILCLPEDDLYQDVLFDSATCDVGFVKGSRFECFVVGLGCVCVCVCVTTCVFVCVFDYMCVCSSRNMTDLISLSHLSI